MAANDRGEPCMGGLVDVIEHNTSCTFGREGQALREIRLPDCPLQPVVLVVRRAGHAFSLTGICRWPSEKRRFPAVCGDFATHFVANVTTPACYTDGADCLKLLTIHEN